MPLKSTQTFCKMIQSFLKHWIMKLRIVGNFFEFIGVIRLYLFWFLGKPIDKKKYWNYFLKVDTCHLICLFIFVISTYIKREGSHSIIISHIRYYQLWIWPSKFAPCVQYLCCYKQAYKFLEKDSNPGIVVSAAPGVTRQLQILGPYTTLKPWAGERMPHSKMQGNCLLPNSQSYSIS